MNKVGSEWTVTKTINLVLVVLFVAVIAIGMTTNGFDPLIEKIGAGANSALSLLGMGSGEDSNGKEIDFFGDELNVEFDLNDASCSVEVENLYGDLETYKIKSGVLYVLENEKWVEANLATENMDSLKEIYHSLRSRASAGIVPVSKINPKVAEEDHWVLTGQGLYLEPDSSVSYYGWRYKYSNYVLYIDDGDGWRVLGFDDNTHSYVEGPEYTRSKNIVENLENSFASEENLIEVSGEKYALSYEWLSSAVNALSVEISGKKYAVDATLTFYIRAENGLWEEMSSSDDEYLYDDSLLEDWERNGKIKEILEEVCR